MDIFINLHGFRATLSNHIHFEHSNLSFIFGNIVRNYPVISGACAPVEKIHGKRGRHSHENGDKLKAKALL